VARVFVRGAVLWLEYRDARGKLRRESTGLPKSKKKAARAMLAERHHAKYSAGRGAKAPLLGEYAEGWIAKRVEEGKAVEAQASRLRTHVLPVLGDHRLDAITVSDVRELVRQLRAGRTQTGRALAPRTIQQIVRALGVVYKDARIDEVLPPGHASPVVFRAGDLPPMVDADPDFRGRSIYTREEADRLMSDAAVPEHMRVAFAVLFLTGCRAGELVALRWGDLHERAPRWCLRIARSWQEARGREKSTKTGVVRDIPVHPALLPRLLEWRDVAWPREFGRAPRVAGKPTETDLVLPSPKAAAVHYGIKNLALARADVLRRLALRPRRTHDTRRTFISRAREDGADRDRLKRLTHARVGETFDQYSEFAWGSLCAEVDKLRLAGWVPADTQEAS
jgi:integrase